MSKKVKIDHTNLKGCINKLLTATDLTALVARSVQHILIAASSVKGCDVSEGMYKMCRADSVPIAVLNCIRVLGTCPTCKSIIPLRFDKVDQLLPFALVYLIQHNKFGDGDILIPTVDEIAEDIETGGILLEFEAHCDHCGFEEAAYIVERNHVDAVGTPKLTT